MSNLGVNVQKFSFNLEAKKPRAQQAPYVKQWRWWIGMVLVVLGAIGDFVCFALAPQSIVTPMGSFTLVTNVFFAHMWLGEELYKTDLIGTGMILVGATVAVSFGDHTEKCYNLKQLAGLYANAGVIVYIVVMLIMLAAMYSVVKKCEKMLEAAGEGPLPAEYEKYAKLHPLCYAGLAGTFGANTCLFAKSTAEILKTTFGGDNQMIYFFTYVILVGMFTCIALEQHWLATGLKYFDALYVVPVFQSFFIGVSVVGGGVYFNELGAFDAVQWICFPTGVLLCLSGVLLLSKRKMESDEEKKSKQKAAALAAHAANQPVDMTDISVAPGRPKPQPRRASGGRRKSALDIMPIGLGGAELEGRRKSFLRHTWRERSQSAALGGRDIGIDRQGSRRPTVVGLSFGAAGINTAIHEEAVIGVPPATPAGLPTIPATPTPNPLEGDASPDGGGGAAAGGGDASVADTAA